jgi:hypothetical protein
VDAQGIWRDLSGVVHDIAPAVLGPDSMARLAALDTATLPVVPTGVRLGPCVGGVGNVVCIGLNYADHAAEAGLKAPGQPIVFNKHSGAISGPNDDVWLAPGSQKLDWEVELGVVIGQRAFHVSEADALQPCGRLLPGQRRVRAGLPDRIRGPVDQGQELPHALPDRPLAGDARRTGRPAGRGPVAGRQRAAAPDGQHAHHDLWCGADRELPQPLHGTATR